LGPSVMFSHMNIFKGVSSSLINVEGKTPSAEDEEAEDSSTDASKKDKGEE